MGIHGVRQSMTIWARTSTFREVFEETDWQVTLEERETEVEFVATAKPPVTIQLDSFEWQHMLETVQAVGQTRAELEISGNQPPEIRVTVPREALPEDYDD